MEELPESPAAGGAAESPEDSSDEEIFSLILLIACSAALLVDSVAPSSTFLAFSAFLLSESFVFRTKGFAKGATAEPKTLDVEFVFDVVLVASILIEPLSAVISLSTFIVASEV